MELYAYHKAIEGHADKHAKHTNIVYGVLIYIQIKNLVPLTVNSISEVGLLIYYSHGYFLLLTLHGEP